MSAGDRKSHVPEEVEKKARELMAPVLGETVPIGCLMLLGTSSGYYLSLRRFWKA